MSNRQQTMAKLARERTLRERRARKLEKKAAAAAERKARAEGTVTPTEGESLGEAAAE
jgi:cell division protein FtsB